MIDDLFSLDENALELIIRTSVIYLALIVALRLVGRREFGSLEIHELLLIVLIADGVSNGLSGSYESVSGALIVAGTLLAWSYLIAQLIYRFEFVRALMRPAPLPLIKDGKKMRRNMRSELITDEEMESLLRAQGIEDLAEVTYACMEPDGEFSVIKNDGGENQKRRRRDPAAGA